MLIERLSFESGLPINRLAFFAQTASNRYYVFSIPKRTGGERQIAHPARPLKAVQRWISSKYLSQLPVHKSATAYRRGSSIRKNAETHASSKFTLRVDFRDFFPNFTILHVYQFLKDQQEALGIDDRDLRFVSQIVCRHGGLTIGSPTSPVLTNAIMFSFDEAVFKYCKSNGLKYTRYADDIFISSSEPNKLGEAYQIVRRVADNFKFANLKINGRKTAFLSRRYKRLVTGLVITPQGKISIGRDRKRKIKALIHQLLKGELSGEKVSYLKGLLSFVSDVEPDFVQALRKKYGNEYVEMLHYTHAPIPTSFSALEFLERGDESE